MNSTTDADVTTDAALSDLETMYQMRELEKAKPALDAARDAISQLDK